MSSIDELMPLRRPSEIRDDILRRSHRRLWKRRFTFGGAPVVVAVAVVATLVAVAGAPGGQTLKTAPADAPTSLDAADGDGAVGSASPEVPAADDKPTSVARRVAAGSGAHGTTASAGADGGSGAAVQTGGGGQGFPSRRALSKIVFNSSDAGGINQLMIMDGDGSNRRKLDTDKYAADGVLSPDATRVAFTSAAKVDVGGQTSADSQHMALYVADVAGGPARTVLTSPKYSLASPDWSPDGTRLLVQVSIPHAGFGSVNPGADEIWSVGADGSNPRMVLYGRQPRWSPKGDAILFISEDGGLYLSDANGQNQRLIVAPKTSGVRSACWSPDGRILSIQDGTSLVVMDVDGSNTKTVYSGSDQLFSASWSPDQATIAFERQMGQSSVWRIKADGSDLVRLSGPNDRDRLPRYPSFAG